MKGKYTYSEEIKLKNEKEELDRNTYRKQIISTINNPNINTEEKGQLLDALANRYQVDSEKKFAGQVFDKPKVKGPIKRR